MSEKDVVSRVIKLCAEKGKSLSFIQRYLKIKHKIYIGTNALKRRLKIKGFYRNEL